MLQGHIILFIFSCIAVSNVHVFIIQHMSDTNVVKFHDLYVNSQTLVICIPNSHDCVFVLKLISSFHAFIVDVITWRLENKTTMRSRSKCSCGTK